MSTSFDQDHWQKSNGISQLNDFNHIPNPTEAMFPWVFNYILTI